MSLPGLQKETGAPVRFNEAHVLLEKHLKELDLYWTKEAQFHPTRKWRFDFLLYRWEGTGLLAARIAEPLRIAVEIEGAIWSRGRHTRGKGYQADLDKYNAATMMGYRVLRFSTHDVLTGRAKAFLKEHLGGNGALVAK
jgi:hypothetical protein